MKVVVFGRDPRNKFNIGIDIGWGLEDGVLWWGNTKDERSKELLKQDLLKRYKEVAFKDMDTALTEGGK